VFGWGVPNFSIEMLNNDCRNAQGGLGDHWHEPLAVGDECGRERGRELTQESPVSVGMAGRYVVNDYKLFVGGAPTRFGSKVDFWWPVDVASHRGRRTLATRMNKMSLLRRR